MTYSHYLDFSIDCFSRVGYVRILKDKRSQTVAEAFASILADDSPFPPAYVATDR